VTTVGRALMVLAILVLVVAAAFCVAIGWATIRGG
jgi:hypothetical protein